MPLIKYLCTDSNCKNSFAVYKNSAKDIDPIHPCKKCGTPAKRVLSAPSSSSKIVIDNGQAKAVEVDPDIMELREDWSKPTDRGD